MAEPTRYADVNRVLKLLNERVYAVLGDELVGLYVHGSLAMGDFAVGRSDIDFLVVTEDRLSETLVAAIKALHAEITALGRTDTSYAWATHLEGSYMPRAAVRRYDRANDIHPALRVDGSFDYDGHGVGWTIQRAVIREFGITLAGPPPDTLIDPLDSGDLRRASAGVLHSWWVQVLRDPHVLQTNDYQVYAVLTMCRSLYTYHTGEVATKSNAATWARAQVDDHWVELIDRALLWRDGMPFDDLEAVLALIRYMMERVPPEL